MEYKNIADSFLFEDEFINSEYNTTTLYFTGPKEILNRFHLDFPEAESCTVSIEFDENRVSPENIHGVMISPTKGGSDYNWCEIDIVGMPIEEFIDAYNKIIKEPTQAQNREFHMEPSGNSVVNEEPISSEELPAYINAPEINNTRTADKFAR